ncbi:hypothetical protein [Microlunatus sp. GCM10028923]|uniref:hypothetical protein n=1 Tax=Microlunatus sp. GCM10028923 TaxID=3273400 RepID=UPI00361A3A73
MTLGEQGALMDLIGRAAVDQAPPGWTWITIVIDAMGDSARVDSVAHTDESETPFNLGGPGGLACLDLREAMYRPKVGTWYRAHFRIDVSGQLASDFDYDSRPYDAEEEGSADVRDVLLHDHEMYPRDKEHLPDWHPAKQH